LSHRLEANTGCMVQPTCGSVNVWFSQLLAQSSGALATRGPSPEQLALISDDDYSHQHRATRGASQIGPFVSVFLIPNCSVQRQVMNLMTFRPDFAWGPPSKASVWHGFKCLGSVGVGNVEQVILVPVQIFTSNIYF
jgi:hypothetical protein